MLVIILLFLTGFVGPLSAVRSFYVDYDRHIFVKDGLPFHYVSGSFHYFRIPSEYWEDRLQKAKAAGLDAIQVYVAWNFHEEKEGVYNFGGDHDVLQFIELIHKHGMLAIVRAGPYICAEWRYGGLPPWLLTKNPEMKIRSSDPEYMTYVSKWFAVLLPKIRPYLYENGGPIIMIQLENEYGSYDTCDQHYMSLLYEIGRAHLGNNVVLFTTDGGSQYMLQCGSPDPRFLATIDFGPTAEAPAKSFQPLEEYRPGLPWVNSEFYSGWFDSWGYDHARTATGMVANSLERLMNYSERVSVNIYMFHGGTNFGFWNGMTGSYVVTTSYDYDSPLSEAGDVTPKYDALQKTIHRIKGLTPPPLPQNVTRTEYRKAGMKYISHVLYQNGEEWVSPIPLTMEALKQYEGFMVYKVQLPKTEDSFVNLEFERFEDIAHIFTKSKWGSECHFHVSLPSSKRTAYLDLATLSRHDTLVILMENVGYRNYGSDMWNNVKGIVGNVRANKEVLRNWIMTPVRDPFGVNNPKNTSNDWYLPIPGSIFSGEFLIPRDEDRHDTFLQLDNFVRGVVAVNGNWLGKYNQVRGPQTRLYVPRQFLLVGMNQLAVTELGWITGPPEASFFNETLW